MQKIIQIVVLEFTVHSTKRRHDFVGGVEGAHRDCANAMWNISAPKCRTQTKNVKRKFLSDCQVTTQSVLPPTLC